MSKTVPVVLPKVGTIELVIQSKRDIRSNQKHNEIDDESHEWFYWNRVWASEVALSEFLIQEFYLTTLRTKTILELGCGTGLAGLVCAKLGGVPTFSDKVPLVMESIQEACRLNDIAKYHMKVWDWTQPQKFHDSFDIVLGSEIFYDDTFLEDICQLLTNALPAGGIGYFCDPNRLGLEAVESCFSQRFELNVRDLEVEWPRKPSDKKSSKKVLLYQLIKKG